MIDATGKNEGSAAQQPSHPDVPAARPPAGWAYQLAPIRRASSGYRVAAGIISIVLSLWVALFYIQMTTKFSYYRHPDAEELTTMTFMFLCTWGSFITGIVMLAGHRGTGKIVPSIVGISAICDLLGFGLPASYSQSFPYMMGKVASAAVVALVLVDMKRA